MVNISGLEEDAIMELINMFSYQTTIALQSFIKNQVELKINSKNIISLDNKPDQNAKPMMYLNIFTSLKDSDLDGNIVITFPKDSVLELFDIISNFPKGSTPRVDENVKNLFQEIGNVVAGKILSVLSKTFNLKVRHTVPSMVPAFGAMINDYIYYNVEDKNDKAILIKVDVTFKLEDEDITGNLTLLLSHESFDILLNKINGIIDEK